MFQRRVSIEIVGVDGKAAPCPVKGLDSFAMRNFTNDAVFDDTLPVGDGVMEVGHRVPLERLRAAMEDWLRRKSYLGGGTLRVVAIWPCGEVPPSPQFGVKYGER